MVRISVPRSKRWVVPNRYMFPARGADCINGTGQFLLEHLLVEKDQGVHGLILCCRGDLPLQGKLGKKHFNFLFTLNKQLFPLFHSMKKNKTGDPATVGPFGVDGIMLAPHDFPDFFKNFFLFWFGSHSFHGIVTALCVILAQGKFT